MYSVAINLGAAGEHILVPAVPGKKIRVINYVLTSDKDSAVCFHSGYSALTGSLYLRGAPVSAFAGQLYPSGALMLFQTATGESLNASVLLDANVTGHLVYILVD